MPTDDWERANDQPWPHEGSATVCSDDYPPTCTCDPPSHSIEQIDDDRAFHARACPEHPGRRP